MALAKVKIDGIWVDIPVIKGKSAYESYKAYGGTLSETDFNILLGNIEAITDNAVQATTDANEAAESANTAANSVQESIDLATEIATHPTIIQNGTWWEWDTETNQYVDSGQAATPYENYLQNTTDDPILTETEWSVWSKEQGDFAEEQGDYAKEQGELAQTARENIEGDLALKIDKTSITSELGDSEELVMSQKGVKDEITQLDSDVSLFKDESNLKDAIQDSKIKDIESIISTMNPNQSVQVSVSGVSPLSLPKNAANGGMSVKLEGLTEDVGGVITNFEPTGRIRSLGDEITPLAFEQGGLNSGGNIIGSSSSLCSPDFITVKENGKLILACKDPLYVIGGIYYYKTDESFISRRTVSEFSESEKRKLIISPPNNCSKIKLTYRKADASFLSPSDVIGKNIFSLYSNETSLYLTAPELRSSGAVKDEIRKGANGYELVKRVGVGTLGDEMIPNAADREFSSDTGWWTKAGNTVIANGVVKITSDGTANNQLFRNNALTPDKWYILEYEVISNTLVGGNTSNQIYMNELDNGVINNWLKSSVGKHKYYAIGIAGGRLNIRIYPGTSTSGYIEIDNISVVEISTVGAKTNSYAFTELSDGTILYTLATPQIIPISYGGILNSAENGTVYHEPIIADAGVYDTKMDILLTDYPIATIEEIIKHENGIDTYLNVATAVIASDGLSFTHPDLADGDLVLFTYAFDKESTNGNITASFYDSNVVKIDTVTEKAYRITDVITNGVLTRTLTEV